MATPNNHHPLPSPPGQQTPVLHYQNALPASPDQSPQGQKQRPRSRGFSVQSHKSHASSGSNNNKERLHESHGEKEAKRLHSKADPTLAMNEAEPSAVAATVKSSLASLRAMQYKDAFGNPIADPDRSNPTRSRWERPLDTIRSFEAAIDGGYNRKSFIRSDTESLSNGNRRNSYYANNNNGSSGRFQAESYYGGGRASATFKAGGSAVDLRQEAGVGRDGYYDQQGYGGAGYGGAGYPNGHPTPPAPGRQRYPRTASEPQFNNFRNGDPGVYPSPNNHRSYETVASGSGSGTSGEVAGYQTDLTSSDNSSIERRQSPPKRGDPANDYGIGFTPSTNYSPSGFTVGFNGRQQPQPPNAAYYGNGVPSGYAAPPPAPRKDDGVSAGTTLKKQLTQASTNSAQRPETGEKRKGWFSRRFSKHS